MSGCQGVTESLQRDATFSHPTAPLSWQRDAVPHQRHKAYSETRPNDFASLREVPAKAWLLRLLVGRLLTSDGQDLQDDYTVPIEREFIDRPLGWILKYTYCRARGIRDTGSELSVRFMLEEAGAGLGWLSVDKSPSELQLKDTDIVEVLVTRADGTAGCTVEGTGVEEVVRKHRWPHSSWREATELFEKTQRSGFAGPESWVPEVWSALDRHAEDDNVVVPGLRVLVCFAQEIDKVHTGPSRAQLAACGQDGVCTLLRLLSLHSQNRAVQHEGWSLLAALAAEPLLQPLLVQRNGAHLLATRVAHAAELQPDVVAHARKVLACLEGVPRPSAAVAGGPRPCASKPCVPSAPGAARAQAAAGESAKESPQRRSKLLVARLQRSVEQSDTLVTDKTLRLLLRKCGDGSLDFQTLQAGGLGKLLGSLRGYEGDPDIRELAQRAISALAKLQQADAIRA